MFSAIVVFGMLAMVLFVVDLKKGLVGNCLFLVPCVYFLSAVSSIFISQDNLPSFLFEEYQAWHALVYVFFLGLALLPVKFMQNYNFSYSEILRLSSLKPLFLILSIGVWFSFFYQTPYAIQSMTMGADTVRHGLVSESLEVLPTGMLTTIAVGLSSFYLVFIIFFYVAVVSKMSVYIVISMFTGGLLYVLSNLAFAGRDGVVYYVLSMFFAHWIFRPWIDKKQLKIINGVFGVSFAILFGLIFSITVQRFGASDSSGIFDGTVSYIGQQPYVFAETLVSQSDFYGLSLRFPFFESLFSDTTGDIVRTMPYEWSFGTFIKDFYTVTGFGSLVTLTVIFSLIFVVLFACKKNIDQLFVLFLVVFYFQFMISGVFYFRLGSVSGNQYILLYILMLVFIHLFVRRLSHKENNGNK